MSSYNNYLHRLTILSFIAYLQIVDMKLKLKESINESEAREIKSTLARMFKDYNNVIDTLVESDSSSDEC